MLSILIPTYNYDVFPLVENLFNQCEKVGIEYEILVLDDCSTEKIIIERNSEIQKFRNVFLFKNEKNSGRTQTRKILAEKAKYDWLLFLDSDVIPAKENFISKYIKAVQNKYNVILGGCSYHSFNVDSSTVFRWKYGTEREEIPVDVRNKNPYRYIFSGNILIDKLVFLKTNFNKSLNLYGMDNYFAYQLYINDIKITHINNEIIHLGLEPNEVFFGKSLQSVKNRKKYLTDLPEIGKINTLLKHYNRLKKLRLTKLVSFIFKMSEPYLKKKVLSKNPNLLCFDLYRLGYICSIK